MKAIRLVLSHTSTDSTLVSIIRISLPVNSPVIVPCALGAWIARLYHMFLCLAIDKYFKPSAVTLVLRQTIFQMLNFNIKHILQCNISHVIYIILSQHCT